MVELRHLVNDSFRALWARGVDAYVKGDWAQTKGILEECLRLTDRKDGPSKFLFEQLEEHNFQAPSHWQGFRDCEGGGH